MLRLSLMRFLDRCAGTALCAFLDCVDIAAHPFIRAGAKSAREPCGPTAVVKLWGMGSVILSAPALKAIRRGFPKSKIVYLTFSENVPVVDALRMADEIIPLRRSGLMAFSMDVLRAVRRLRRLRVRRTIDLEFVSRFTAILMYASGAPERIGFSLPRMYRGNRLLTTPVFYNMYAHIVVSWLELARAAGAGEARIEEFLGAPLLEARKEWRESLWNTLERRGIRHGEEMVAVNVNAGEIGVERRRWPAGHFESLVEETAARHPEVRFVFTGSASESSYVARVMAGIRGARMSSLTGLLSPEELIALLGEVRLLITNDSGPLHMAAAVGTRTVSFFGPESPVIYGPLGTGHTVFYRGCYCSPCHNMFNAKEYRCPYDLRCLREICPSEVLEVVDREIRNRAVPQR
ncbi:MAG: glycosyltransferase family 9 protein [Chlamydiota bacterium]